MRPIDADALVEMFKTQYECETCDNYDGVRCRACHCDDALGIIDSAPTIDAAPVRRSEWVTDDDNNDDWAEPYCKKCGCSIPCGPAHFCPNCGADMRGETNESLDRV